MIKQQTYEKMLSRRSGLDYSLGIQFQTSLVNMDEAKTLTMKNQLGKSMDKKKRCQFGSLDHLCITPKELSIGISYRNAKKVLGDSYF